MMNPKTYAQDIKALDKFPKVNFSGDKADFRLFKRNMNRRVIDPSNPLISRLKTVPLNRIEAAIYQYYIQLCHVRDEVSIASRFMSAKVVDLEFWRPANPATFSVSRMRLLGRG